MQLPHKLSALTRLAINDLQLVMADPDYKVNMNTWHEPREGKCAVCFAGSVMAKSLGVSQKDNISPSQFGENNNRALCALDLIRIGRIKASLELVDQELPRRFPVEVNVTPFAENPEEFIADMKYLADLLEQRGF